MTLPSFKTKSYLSKVTGLKINQIQNWFINARKRYLEPLIADEEQKQQVALKNKEESFNNEAPPCPQLSLEHMVNSNQIAFLKFTQVMHQIKPTYDSIDISEAIVLNNQPNSRSSHPSPDEVQDLLTQQYYNFYLNNFLAYLSLQNQYTEQLNGLQNDRDDKIPVNSIRNEQEEGSNRPPNPNVSGFPPATSQAIMNKSDSIINMHQRKMPNSQIMANGSPVNNCLDMDHPISTDKPNGESEVSRDSMHVDMRNYNGKNDFDGDRCYYQERED